MKVKVAKQEKTPGIVRRERNLTLDYILKRIMPYFTNKINNCEIASGVNEDNRPPHHLL